MGWGPMAASLDRRTCLALGIGGLSIAVVGCGGGDDAPACTLADADVAPSTGATPQDVEAIATWILSVDEAALVGELRARLASEWTVDSVFAGLLLAGVRYVHSKYGGGGFHAVLQVAALRFFVLGAGKPPERAPDADRLVPLVYGILITRAAAAGDPWQLPPIDESKVPSADGAGARLLAAVDAGALDDALLEATALARSGAMPHLQSLLLEIGSRRANHLGHEAIGAAKIVRALRDLPGAWAEDVYRAMIHAMVGPTLPPAPDHAEIWRSNRARVTSIPCTWGAGADDPSAVRKIVVAMRTVTDPAQSVAIVEAHLGAGVSARSIWHGVVLAASESAFGGGNYHAFTAVEALHDAYLQAASERVRLMLLLQAAAYVALITHTDAPAEVPLLDVVPEPATLDEVFELMGSESVIRALGYLQSGGDAGAYVDRVMQTMRTRAFDEHHYKIPHAALAEADRVAPEWRSHALALCRLYAPSAGDAVGAAWELVSAPP